MIRRCLAQEITRTEPVWPEGIVARYLTLGCAVVEVRSHRFSTHWNRDFSVSDTTHDVDGFAWECLGCGDDGRYSGSSRVREDREYLPIQERQAHTDANKHAGQCRALPRPGGVR